jgi:hypothetical protein
MLCASSLPTRIESSRPVPRAVLASAQATPTPEVLAPAPSVLTPPADEPAADDAKPMPPTSLERAKAALAASDAPWISNHEICSTLVEVAEENDLPLGFFTNLIWRESNFDRAAISRVGAMGIAQFMPDVADRLGFDAFDAREALPASGRLLRTLRARFGNLGLMAAAYNAGPKRVSDWLEQRSSLPKETRDYVSIITGHPPEHWRDAKRRTVAFAVPRQIPCHRTPAFSQVAQAERAAQLAQIAEEKAIEQKKLAEQKKRADKKTREAHKKATGRKTILASRGRAG